MRRSIGLVAILGGVLAACGGGGASGPPAILYGEDICDHCRMVISEERHAAGAVIDGRQYRFDDPGCLQTHLGGLPEGTAAAVWVHDESGSWLPAETAWFVRDPDGVTPMGSGILSYASPEAAVEAHPEAVPRRWDEIGAHGSAGAE